MLTQKAHFKSSNIPRLEAAVNVYTALSKEDSLRVETLKKLTAMLLHPYPRVSLAKLFSPFDFVPCPRSYLYSKLTIVFVYTIQIRIPASDSLYMITQSTLIKDENWTAPPKELKPTVEQLRSLLF